LKKIGLWSTFSPMNDFTDTHFHLSSMKEKGIDIDNLDLNYGMDIGCEADDILYRLPLIEKHPGLVYSMGAGPWCTSHEESAKEQVMLLEKHIKENHPVCIGEIGLDYFHSYGSVEKQKELFKLQLELASKLHLPVAIHTRDADEDTIEILREHSFPRRGIMHCFSGSRELARTALEKGFFLSFAGNVTYKANSHLAVIAQEVPLESLLLETDSPYLSPVPLRGRLNTPLNIEYTYGFIAEKRGMKMEDLKEAVKENFKAFLGV